MLITLDDFKEQAGVTESDNDDFLTSQIALISETVESYCRRFFLEKTYIQTYYAEDYFKEDRSTLALYNFPVSEITSITADGVAVNLTNEKIRLHKPTGILTKRYGHLFYGCQEFVVTYKAGYLYADLPRPIQDIVKSLVLERYNKKISGVNLNFGSDVQRVSIPGTISVDFDYSLQSNERSTTFGTILGNYVNVLDYYRSERVIQGNGKLSYVEE